MINIPKSQTAIFIPTLGRGHKLLNVVTNLYEVTSVESMIKLYFIAESHDQATIDAINKLAVNLIINEGKPCYADAINTAYRATKERYFFTGADDLNFHKNWLQNALKFMTNGKQVIGTNDMGEIPIGEQRNSTHYLVDRKYIEEQSGVIDILNSVLYPYDHNYTDTEFTQTAMSRGVYDYASDSFVEHMHPAWGKAQLDDTYKRGNNTNSKDLQTFQERKHLWSI